MLDLTYTAPAPKVIAGANRRSSGVMTKNEFSRWAKHEVELHDENWRRVDEDETASQ